MGWPLNTVESLGSFSAGRYGAPLWSEGRLRLTAGQLDEAPNEAPGSCRSRGPAIGHKPSSATVCWPLAPHRHRNRSQEPNSVRV